MNNPEPDGPLVARFKVRREDFPPNIQELTTQHLLLYIVLAEQADPIETVPVTLTLTPLNASDADALSATATTMDGIVSTRRTSGNAWEAFTNQSPTGDWELGLPLSLASQFETEQIDDILLVITYQGRTPPWPA